MHLNKCRYVIRPTARVPFGIEIIKNTFHRHFLLQTWNLSIVKYQTGKKNTNTKRHLFPRERLVRRIYFIYYYGYTYGSCRCSNNNTKSDTESPFSLSLTFSLLSPSSVAHDPRNDPGALADDYPKESYVHYHCRHLLLLERGKGEGEKKEILFEKSKTDPVLLISFYTGWNLKRPILLIFLLNFDILSKYIVYRL